MSDDPWFVPAPPPEPGSHWAQIDALLLEQGTDAASSRAEAKEQRAQDEWTR